MVTGHEWPKLLSTCPDFTTLSRMLCLPAPSFSLPESCSPNARAGPLDTLLEGPTEEHPPCLHTKHTHRIPLSNPQTTTRFFLSFLFFFPLASPQSICLEEPLPYLSRRTPRSRFRPSRWVMTTSSSTSFRWRAPSLVWHLSILPRLVIASKTPRVGWVVV